MQPPGGKLAESTEAIGVNHRNETPSGNVPVWDVDPYAEEILVSPQEYYAELRDKGPLVWLSRYGVWASGRFAEIKTIFSDWERFRIRDIPQAAWSSVVSIRQFPRVRERPAELVDVSLRIAAQFLFEPVDDVGAPQETCQPECALLQGRVGCPE